MWILTPVGFFSIVEKPDDSKSGTLTIRARVKADLERLRELYLPSLSEISANAGTDYRYRARAPRGEVGIALANMTLDLNYANFKDEVAKRQGKSRAAYYGKVWDVLYGLSEAEGQGNPPKITAAASTSPTAVKASAYGGVVLDKQKRVLLREPANHFDGYVWTFPKGRPDRGETPEQAAIREVREETGYPVKIVGKIPGQFPGGTTITEYFLMEPTGKPGQFDKETTSVQWVDFAGAEVLIKKSTNKAGRNRDLSVLEAVRKWLAGA